MKVKDGKGLGYSAYLKDTVTKLAQVRVDAGINSSFIIAQAVTPAGRSARCDYHLLYGFIGFPTEPSTAEQTAADMKKAGITMTREEMIANRDELSFLVGQDIWRWETLVSLSPKGGYARLNYYKTKPGMSGDWVHMETTGWKLLAEAAAKEIPGTAWGVATLAMPGGDSLAYNGLTFDAFPSWAALGKGLPVRATWNKVHPDMEISAYLDRLTTIVDRPRVDIVKLTEVIRAK